jgi:hypothetical protein
MSDKETEITEVTPGIYKIGEFEFQAHTLGNWPFCHFCRRRVERSLVIFSSREGANPKHICHECCKEILVSFMRLPNSQPPRG